MPKVFSKIFGINQLGQISCDSSPPALSELTNYHISPSYVWSCIILPATCEGDATVTPTAWKQSGLELLSLQ